MKTIIAALIFGAVLSAQPVMVVLVRHAEKADVPKDDPPLTKAGAARARDLARVLRDVRPAAIYVSEKLRTQLTAEPFAKVAGVSPELVASADELPAKILQHKGATVVMVGHSDTVPKVIRKLGGPEVTIAETEFFHLYVLTVAETGRASLVSLRYGAE